MAGCSSTSSKPCSSSQRPEESSTTFLVGFDTGLDWIPIQIVDALPPTSSCCLCGIVPKSTNLLDCSHAFCYVCYRGILRNDRKCPLDQNCLREGRVRELALDEWRVMQLRARCHNSRRGCGFTGDVRATLEHSAIECDFGAVPCRRCGVDVARKGFVNHYSLYCEGSAGRPKPGVAGMGARVRKNLEVLRQGCTSFQDCINRSTEQLGAAIRSSEELRRMADEMAAMRAVLKQMEGVKVALTEDYEMFLQDVVGKPKTGAKHPSFGSHRACPKEELVVASPPSLPDPDCAHVHITGLDELVKEALMKVNSPRPATGSRDSHVFVVGGYTCFLVSKVTVKRSMSVDFTLVARRDSRDGDLPWPIERSKSLTLLHPETETMNIKAVFSEHPRPAKVDALSGWCVEPESYRIGSLPNTDLLSLIDRGYVRPGGTVCAVVEFH